LGSETVKLWARELHGRIARENGWGPHDGRPAKLSWDTQTIRNYADEYGIETLLDTATAARTGSQQGYNMLQAYEVLRPVVIHLSDYSHHTGLENLVPGNGNYEAELKELITAIKHTAVIVVLEVAPRPNAFEVIRKTLDFIDAC
jgi:hypothetical protein